MTINKTIDGNTETLALGGWLDYDAAPGLAEELKELGSGVTSLVLDCSDLEYISSSGVRLFVEAYSKMKGAVKLRNVSEDVMEVLRITGVADRIPVEQS